MGTQSLDRHHLLVLVKEAGRSDVRVEDEVDDGRGYAGHDADQEEESIARIRCGRSGRGH